MSRRSFWNPKDRSIDAEPALNAGEIGGTDEGDGLARREADAARQVARERTAEHGFDAIDRSVFDEPVFSPELSGVGRDAGSRFSALYAERRLATRASTSWAVAFLLAMTAGPISVIGAFFSTSGEAVGTLSQWVLLAFVGPVTEETLKIVAATMVLERRPWLFRGVSQFVFIGLMSGLAFASIENVLYLKVYFPDATAELIAWRWSVCVVLHAGCSLIAALGLARVWRVAHDRTERPTLEAGFPLLITAIVLHGIYNSFAIVLHYTGVL